MSSVVQPAHRTYFPYIDGLRGLSIFAVVLFHLDASLLPAGFGGVDIFFVVSGFVVSASLHGIPFGRFRDLLVFFYARRLRRVVPALAVVLLVSSLVTTLFVPFAYLSSQIKETGLAAFAGFSNVILAVASNGYFAPRAEYNPFTHTWSLGVEEQFYLVFPFLYFAFLKSQRTRIVGLACLLLLMACSVAYCFVSTDATHRFYMIFGRFWELGTGVCLYLYLEHGRGRDEGRSVGNENQLLSYLGAAIIGAGLFVTTSAQFPLPGGLMPVAGTALLVLGLHGRHAQSWVGRLLTAAPLVKVGLLSYSLYLWHWPVFVLFRWTVGFETPAQKLAAIAVALVLSVASYQFVERPFRTTRLLRAPRVAIPGVLAFVVCCGLASLLVFSGVGVLSRSVVMQNRSDWYPQFDFAAQREDGCRIERSRVDSPGAFVLDIKPSSCREQNPGFTLFVVGDSHADAYVSMFSAYALTTGTRVVVHVNFGCSPIEFIPAAPECKRLTARSLAAVRQQANPGDVVFVSSLTVPRFRDQWNVERIDLSDRVARHAALGIKQEAIDQAPAILANVLGAGVKVVFELPKPIFPTPLFRCSDWFNRMNPICRDGLEISRAQLEEYRRPVVETVRLIGERVPGLQAWDSFAVLCPGTSCRMTHDGKPLYFDADHVSGYGNRLLLPSFAEMIEKVRKPPASQ